MKKNEQPNPNFSKKTKKNKNFRSDIDLSNPEFTIALDLLTKTNSSVFLTGKAGTGKSTFLRYISEITQKKHVILAPTGIAAVNVGGQTIHSFFKIPLKPLLPDDPDFAIHRLRKRLKYSSSHIKLIRSLELIIIDEISMVRADIIDFIDKILRIYSGNMRTPFGGKQMLFVGDVFQLEPVVTGNDRDVLAIAYSSFYFFNARVFSETNLVPIELTKVYRQNESRFIELLDNIRLARPTAEDLHLLNTRINTVEQSLSSSSEKSFTMTIATRRDMVDEINNSHLEELKSPKVIYKGKITDDFPQNALPTDLELNLKVGAQVVFIKNDPDKRWVNGTLAVVEECAPDNLTVRTEDGVVHKLDPEIWDNVKYTYNEKDKTVEETVLGTFTQYPLKLAWALTIHKSQGLTFNKVIIDLGRGAFSGGQTYVALSRSRTLDGITLRGSVSPRDIYVHPKILHFASKFNDDNLISQAIASNRANELFKSAIDAFEHADITKAVELFIEGNNIHNVLTRSSVRRLIIQKLNIINRQKETIGNLYRQLEEKQKRLDSMADEYTRLGNECRTEGWDLEAAIRNFNKAIELSPKSFDAYLGRGKAYLTMGNISQAGEDYKTALQLSGKSRKWEVLLAYGELYESDGDVFSAINYYLDALDNNSTNLSILNRLVDIYERIGESDSAEEYRRQLNKLRQRSGKRKK